MPEAKILRQKNRLLHEKNLEDNTKMTDKIDQHNHVA